MNAMRTGITVAITVLLLGVGVPSYAGPNADTVDNLHAADFAPVIHDHGTSGIQDQAVTGAKIANGAVTDAKISGTISSSKIQTTGLDSDMVDGKHASDLAEAIHPHEIGDVNGLATALGNKADSTHAHDDIYQKKYANVIVVSVDGNGDFTSPVDAMDSITDASSTNPYLVKIMPGVFWIDSGIVQMKEFVDIEGSGENTTIIEGSVTTYFDPVYSVPPTGAVVMGANNAELRLLTVLNSASASSGPDHKLAILNSGTSPAISDVTAISSNGSYRAKDWAVLNYQASPIMKDMTIIASGGSVDVAVKNYESSPVMKDLTIVAGTGIDCAYSSSEMSNIRITSEVGVGIWLNGSSPVLKDVTITASEGLHIMQGSSPTLLGVKVSASTNALAIYGANQVVTIDHSVLEGGYSVLNTGGSAYTLRIGASKLAGTTSFGSGVVTCAGAYDGTYTALDATCQ